MDTIISIGRQLLPIENIALVEPFDRNVNPEFKPLKDFKSRVVQLNRVAGAVGDNPAGICRGARFPDAGRG